jgi:hypothetical protein
LTSLFNGCLLMGANICYNRTAVDAGGLAGKPPHSAAGCFRKRLGAGPFEGVALTFANRTGLTFAEVFSNPFNVNRTRITSR